jgi:hemerythrin-like domain-containing protein
MLRELLGMPEGILKDLRQDHDEVSSLIEELIESEDTEERALLFKEIKTKLLAHSQAEQAVLYRKMEKSKDEEARSFAFEGDNEHHIVEQQLEQMSRSRNKASEQWTAQATVLRELVNHHVKEEEGTGFRCAAAEFDAATLEKLGEQFRRQKEKLLTET